MNRTDHHQIQQQHVPILMGDERDDGAEPTHGPEHSTTRIPMVGFRSIQIREFDRIVGDHPDVTNGGPPLAIGWDYVEGEELDLDDFERQKANVIASKAQLHQQEYAGVRRLSSGRRRDLLRIEFQIPLEEILQAEAEVELVKKQRAQTIKQRKVFAKTQDIMQAAKRKLNRRFSREMTDSHQAFPKRQDVSTGNSVTTSSSHQLHLEKVQPPLPLQTPIRVREVSV